MLVRLDQKVSIYNMRTRINVNSLRLDFSRFQNKTPMATCQLLSPGKVLLKKSDYKPFTSSFAEDMMMRTVLFYLEKNNHSTTVNVISSRLNVRPLQPYPMTSIDNVTGIICLVRENVIGGLVTVHDFQRELIPGEMMLFNESSTISISSLNVDYIQDPNMDGFMDLVIFRS